MENQSRKKQTKLIGGVAVLLLALGACSIYTLTKQEASQTPTVVEVTSESKKEEKKETTTTVQEKSLDTVVEKGTQEVSEEQVQTVISFTEVQVGTESLDRVVVLGNTTSPLLDQVVEIVTSTDTMPTNQLAELTPDKEPVKPEQPVIPVEPVKPTEPELPITPVEPVHPVTPIEPTEPVTPAEPVRPIEPVTPVEPTEPVTPTDPSETVTPTNPTTPVEPTQPEQPTTPELTDDEKALTIQTRTTADGKEEKFAVGAVVTEEALPEFDVALLPSAEADQNNTEVSPTEGVSETPSENTPIASEDTTAQA